MVPIDDCWPVAHVRVDAPRVSLRFPDEHQLEQLASLALAEIHPPGVLPFPITGWQPDAPMGRDRALAQYHWRSRAEWTPERWNLVLVALADNEVVGTQAIGAVSFGVTKAVTTGSWLHPAHQGHGLGTEMRRAVLSLAFDGLGAEVANTSAFETNAASIRVSQRLGYCDNGVTFRDVAGIRVTEKHFQLRRSAWTPQMDIAISGLSDAAAEFFGTNP